jgi:hypothetical protein
LTAAPIVRIRTREFPDPDSWIIVEMSPDVLRKTACKSLRRLIFDANLPHFTVEHGVCLSGMHYWSRSAQRLKQGACFTKEEAFMKRRGLHVIVAVLAVCLLASTHAFAQGGGASPPVRSMASSDTSGGVLPASR